MQLPERLLRFYTSPADLATLSSAPLPLSSDPPPRAARTSVRCLSSTKTSDFPRQSRTSQFPECTRRTYSVESRRNRSSARDHRCRRRRAARPSAAPRAAASGGRSSTAQRRAGTAKRSKQPRSRSETRADSTQRSLRIRARPRSKNSASARRFGSEDRSVSEHSSFCRFRCLKPNRHSEFQTEHSVFSVNPILLYVVPPAVRRGKARGVHGNRLLGARTDPRAVGRPLRVARGPRSGPVSPGPAVGRSGAALPLQPPSVGSADHLLHRPRVLRAVTLRAGGGVELYVAHKRFCQCDFARILPRREELDERAARVCLVRVYL